MLLLLPEASSTEERGELYSLILALSSQVIHIAVSPVDPGTPGMVFMGTGRGCRSEEYRGKASMHRCLDTAQNFIPYGGETN